MPKLIKIIRQLGATGRRARIASVVAGVIFAALLGSYYAMRHDAASERSADASRDIRLRATLVETLVKQAMLAPGLLMTSQSAPIELDRLEASAWMIFQVHEIINGLEVAPAGIPSFQFSRTSNFALSGPTVRQQPTMAMPQSSFGTRGYPIVSIDRKSIVAKQRIQLRTGRNKPEFWGYVTSTVKLADLAKTLRLNELEEQGYAISLDYFRSDAVQGEPILSVGGSQRADSINHEIRLPQGDRMYLRASPPASWNASRMAELAALLAGAFCIGVLTYLLLRPASEISEKHALQRFHLEPDKPVLDKAA